MADRDRMIAAELERLNDEALAIDEFLRASYTNDPHLLQLVREHAPRQVAAPSDNRWFDDPELWDGPWVRCAGDEWEQYPCTTMRPLLRRMAGHPGYQARWADLPTPR